MKNKKNMGVPRPRKSGSRVAGVPSPKTATASRPSTRSRKKITTSQYEKMLEEKFAHELCGYPWIRGWNETQIVATPFVARGFVTVKISSDEHPLTEIHIPSLEAVNDLIGQLVNARHEMKKSREAFATGIAVKARRLASRNEKPGASQKRSPK